MKLRIGFSPCPNDTYLFEALITGAIDTGGLVFEPVIRDVEELNLMARESLLDISKVSYGVLSQILPRYGLLQTGSALGRGAGPLLIAAAPLPEEGLRQASIAIPGRHTTAHVLFSLAYPDLEQKIFLRYDQIEDYVLADRGEGPARAGVIIHENRFTYASRGLVCLADLGQVWEERTGMPVPLGGIVASRHLHPDLARKAESLIRQSLDHARSRNLISDFVRRHAQEMEEQVMRKHIELYVNAHTRDLGATGKQAVESFVRIQCGLHGEPPPAGDVFLTTF